MTHRSLRFVSSAALAASIALLVATAVWYFGGRLTPSAGEAIHLTEAEWLATGASTFSAPPPTQDSRALSGEWRHVMLPAVIPAVSAIAGDAVPASAHAGSPAPRAGEARVTWVRMFVAEPRIPAARLALYSARIKTDGTVAVYVDGNLAYRAQEQGPLWNSLFTPLWFVLNTGLSEPRTPPDNHSRQHEILLRLEHTASNAVAVSSLWVGPPEVLQRRYAVREWLQREAPATLSAAFLVVGIFAFAVWLRRREETGYLLFFNLAATSFAAHLHFFVSAPITSDWFAWLTINALFWLIVVVHLLLCQLHGRPLKGLTYAVAGITLAITVLSLPMIGVLPVLPSTPVIVPLIYAVGLLLGATVGSVGVLCAWRRSREARLVAVGVGLCTLLGVTDWMMHNNVASPEGWFLGAYMNAVTFGVFGTLLFRRYVNAIVEVERMNLSLAQQLKDREAELEVSHRRLREAERQQAIGEERRRLMQDMHDGLGSSLISAIRSVESGVAHHDDVSQILKDCLQDLKLTIDSMEPVEADLLLLLATLRFRLEPRLDGSGVALIWKVRELPPLTWLDPSAALHILRIIQESIANVLRHTRAREISVSTAADRTGVEVVVQDDGQGFDVEAAMRGTAGRGLHNQRRRAQSIGGRVSWHSTPAGTRFTLWLPLQRGARSGG